MKKLVIALSLLGGFVIAAAIGAVTGLYVYQKAYGNFAELSASRAANDIFMLSEPRHGARTDDEVVKRLIQETNMESFYAAAAYDKLGQRFEESFKKALARVADDERFSDKSNFWGVHGSAARACVSKEAADKEAVASCVKLDLDKIRDECSGGDTVICKGKVKTLL